MGMIVCMCVFACVSDETSHSGVNVMARLVMAWSQRS